MPDHKGRCHCGQVEFQATIEDKSHTLCHCETCKHLSGGEYTANVMIPVENFHMQSGEMAQYSYVGDSGYPVHCYYCKNCTAHVIHHRLVTPDIYALRTMLVEGAKNWPIAGEKMVKFKTNWQPLVVQDDSRAYETAPPRVA